MKIIVLLMLLICVNLFGVDVLSAEFSLELGWLPQGTLLMYESRDKYDLSNTFYASFLGRVFILEHIFIGGGMDSSFHKCEKRISFAPEGIDYMFTTGLKFGIAELFFKHNCIHPAPTYIYYRKITPLWEASHDRIGIKISGKIK